MKELDIYLKNKEEEIGMDLTYLSVDREMMTNEEISRRVVEIRRKGDLVKYLKRHIFLSENNFIPFFIKKKFVGEIDYKFLEKQLENERKYLSERIGKLKLILETSDIFGRSAIEANIIENKNSIATISTILDSIKGRKL